MPAERITTDRHSMKRCQLLFFLFLAHAAFGAGGAGAQQDDPIGKLFSDGLSEFRAARYGSAAAAFSAVVDAPGRNPRVTAALVMAAKSEYRAGRFEPALDRARTLLDRFPRSAYADEALYVAALSEFRMGNHDLAASTSVDLLRLHPTSALSGRAWDLFGVIASAHLPLSELKRLTAVALPAGLHTTAAFALANAYVRRGEDTLALRVLENLRSHPDAAGSIPEIDAMLEDIAAGEGIQVAALLPLMAENPDSDIGRIGRDLLDGIRFAAEGHNAGVSRGRRVEILVRDTGRDTAKSAALVRELAVSTKVRVLIGPVFSDIFAAASVEANSLRLPIISPTATADRLAAVGPFIFQANPDNAMRGRAAAQYAVNDLRMSSFAVLASDEPVGRSHAEAFVKEAEALGATVYCSVYFPPEATDLRDAFYSVRRAVMAQGTMVHRSDLLKPEFRSALGAFGIDSSLAAGDSSTDPFVSVTTLFGLRGYAVAESLGLPIASADTTAEETDVPMVSADGIFVALGDPGQLDYVAPQLNYFNIRAQVLGNNEWFDPDRLRDNRESVEGVRFVSDSRFPLVDSPMVAFSNAFEGGIGRKPTKFTLYGYDAMNLVLEQVRSGARSRSEIAARLGVVTGYKGLHSDITLSGGRVNRYLDVMEYSRGAIRRVGSVTVGEH